MDKAIFYRKSDAVPEGRLLVSDDSLREELGDLIRETFQSGSVSWQAVGDGTFHRIFAVSLPHQTWVIKVGLYREQCSSLATEHHIYAHILPSVSLGLRVHHADLTCTRYSFPYLILEKASGKRLRDENLDAPVFPIVITELGRRLRYLHSLPPPEKGWGLLAHEEFYETGNLRGALESWREFIVANLESHVREAYDCKALDGRSRDFVLTLLSGPGAFPVDTCTRSLLHGDIGSHNVFFALDRSPRITAIIDWEDALVGDPVFDIASFASFFRMHEFLDAFLQGYCEIVGPFGNDFEVRLWTYYVRILIAKALQRRRLGRDKPKASVYAPKIKMAAENLRRLV